MAAYQSDQATARKELIVDSSRRFRRVYSTPGTHVLKGQLSLRGQNSTVRFRKEIRTNYQASSESLLSGSELFLRSL